MNISPDAIVFYVWGPLRLNATIVFTWGIIVLLAIGSWMITRRLSTGESLSRWQNFLEIIVMGIQGQIEGISHQTSYRFLPFVGTLFIFIATANILAIIPLYEAPTGSLSTTVGLAICVFIATPVFGVLEVGVRSYLRAYAQPTLFMLPFNIIGEISRTIALAVRLFGNIMSGSMIAAILLSVAPLFFPVLMQALGLLTGLVQAYIFAVLAMVYIASAIQAHRGKEKAEGEIEQT